MKRPISIVSCCLIVLLAGSSAFAQKTAEDFYKLSQQRLMNRDLDGALAAINKAIELQPGVAGLYPKRSELHLMKGDVDAALADLSQALLLDSELTVAYTARGNLRMMKGDMKGALSDLDNAIARGDESDRNYAMRAHLKMMLQDPAGALSDYNSAISMNSTRIGNYLGRAGARKLTGDEAGALADYTYVIDVFEQTEREGTAPDAAARKVRANDMSSPIIAGPTRTKTGDVKVTTKTMMVVTMNPEVEGTMSAEQMEYLPNVAGAYMNRSLIRSRKGDTDAALADLNKSLAIFPHFGAYEMRGKVWQQRGDLKASLADFNKAIELQPGLALAYVERGETLLLMGKDEEAERDFRRCLEIDPSLDRMVVNSRAAAKTRTEKP